MEREKNKLSNIFAPKSKVYLCVIFVLISVIFILNPRVGIVAYLLFVGVSYYSINSNNVKKKEIEKYIGDLKFNKKDNIKGVLTKFPLPIIVIELDGTIIWYNDHLKLIFSAEEILYRPITTFISDINYKEFIEYPNSISKQSVVNGRDYCIMSSLVESGKSKGMPDFVLVIYLIDNTNFVQLRKQYEEQKMCVGIIIIDNYDELMQNTDEYKMPQMLAEINKKIVQYTSITEGILKKYERDKYLFVFEQQYLMPMQEKRFELLDKVKEINIGNKIPVTLSLGFGINGKNFSTNLNYASASIDIALGRGGDQIVIKDGENISFFGGKTREIEKRTRVKARVIALALRELIDQSSAVIIMGHSNCDIDCLGAALGIYRIAVNRNKPVNIVLNNIEPTIGTLVNKLRKHREYDNLFIENNEALHRITSKTLLVVLDTYKRGFTECPELLEVASQIVVIDHHRRGIDSIQDTVLTYQETYASSTCELVTEILQYVEERIKLTEIEAEALYAGIIVDTKNFMFKTGVRTFEAAAYLRRQGVDTVSVKQIFQDDLECYINISGIVQNAEVLYNSMAISESLPGTKNPLLIAAKAADQLISLSGISVAFVLSYLDDGIHISGRSLGNINVQVILEKLGGGGHLTIAGTQLKDVSMQGAKELLKVAITEYVSTTSIGGESNS